MKYSSQNTQCYRPCPQYWWSNANYRQYLNFSCYLDFVTEYLSGIILKTQVCLLCLLFILILPCIYFALFSAQHQDKVGKIEKFFTWLVQSFSFCFAIRHCLTCVFSAFNCQSVHIACFLCSHFLPFLMAKDNSRMKSRAAKWLEPYNKSPANRSSGRSGDDHASGRSSRGGSSRSSHAWSSPPRTSSEPPDWAKELPKQQQANTTELKRLQSEMASLKSQGAQKPCAADPEFRFTGNKKQYQLNKEVLEKIDEALATDDGEDHTKKLTEGKDLLVERNKHI